VLQPANPKISDLMPLGDDLCLNASRFEVEVAWRTQAAAPGRQAVSITADTLFWCP
jgi:hypothetical protein